MSRRYSDPLPCPALMQAGGVRAEAEAGGLRLEATLTESEFMQVAPELVFVKKIVRAECAVCGVCGVCAVCVRCVRGVP